MAPARFSSGSPERSSKEKIVSLSGSITCCVQVSPARDESQPKSVMVLVDLLNGLGHELRIGVGWNLDEHGLIEVESFIKFLFKKPMLNRRERRWSDGSHGRRTIDLFDLFNRDAREFGNRLVLEELFGRHPQTRLAGSSDHLDTQNRVSAQLKEIVVDAD